MEVVTQQVVIVDGPKQAWKSLGGSEVREDLLYAVVPKPIDEGEDDVFTDDAHLCTKVKAVLKTLDGKFFFPGEPSEGLNPSQFDVNNGDDGVEPYIPDLPSEQVQEEDEEVQEEVTSAVVIRVSKQRCQKQKWWKRFVPTCLRKSK